MDPNDDIASLRASLADYERKSRKTKWLLRQLAAKIRDFPKDVTTRYRKSRQKRRDRAAIDRVMAGARETAVPEGASPQAPVSRPLFFYLNPDCSQTYLAALTQDPAARAAFATMEQFCGSAEMTALIADAARIDPEVGSLNGYEAGYLPPWHDGEFARFRAAAQKIPAEDYDSVVLVPFGKLGGADLVAGLLAGALSRQGRTLILRTDLPDWDRPDWYPGSVPAIDISAEFAGLSDRPRALYMLLRQIGARRVWNVNSRLGFEMLVQYGARLATQSQLYAYYFCADRDAAGNEVGYPVWYFANVLPHLTAAICDTRDLAQTLSARYCLPPDLSARVRSVYTPARTPVAPQTLAEAQAGRSSARPRLLWAGRLDRQKRFDLVVALARLMPDVDFDAWGKAVLDAPPDLSGLPPNLTLHPPFADYGDLPLTDADGWLYTSDWDGLPTILIELGAMGMPIVASAVGGVPELIDDTTGWPVAPETGLAGYERAVRAMLDDPEGRVLRAVALQQRIASRHTPDAYDRAIAEIC